MTTITEFINLEQGSEEWLHQRCGILTASTVGRLITPKTLKLSTSKTSSDFVMTLIGERLTGRVEPVHTTRDMERGTLDEPYARNEYEAVTKTRVDQIGFIRADDRNFILGYSPDGLVGTDGLIEIKSRRPRVQLDTIMSDDIPAENMAQIQAGLLVTGRKWCDYISYSGGMALFIKRIEPDQAWHDAIRHAVKYFETTAANIIQEYKTRTYGLPVPEYIDHFAEESIII